MTKQDLRVEEVRNKQDIMTFIRFPWKIYQGDRYWVPPLTKDQLQKFSPTHPFLSHSEMILFLAYRNGEIVGRIAGIIDYNYVEFHQEKVGFFGFFESINDHEVSEALLWRVRGWLKGHGMEKVIGPMSPSTNDECGLLVEWIRFPPLPHDALQSSLLPFPTGGYWAEEENGSLCLPAGGIFFPF